MIGIHLEVGADDFVLDGISRKRCAYASDPFDSAAMQNIPLRPVENNAISRCALDNWIGEKAIRTQLSSATTSKLKACGWPRIPSESLSVI
ncbi:hypothetical protein D3C86_1641750 [compost metagenome]